MRTGPDQRPRRRLDGNRPFRPQGDRAFESNGPGIKVRGNARQIYERYAALAREAAIGGDPIAAENLYQHAEHYLRVANANRENNPPGAPRPTPPAATEIVEREPASSQNDEDGPLPGWGDDRPGFI